MNKNGSLKPWAGNEVHLWNEIFTKSCSECRSNGKGKGLCNKQNIRYRISCVEKCQKKDIYNGETSYSAFTRGKEHLAKLENRDPKSMLYIHCQNEHEGNIVGFKMDITGTFHHDATLRQISEGIDIRETDQRRLMNTRNEWNTPMIPECTIQRRWRQIWKRQIKTLQFY